MKVGVAREIKPAERRVALTPAGAMELVADGHEVLVETAAGSGSGFSDEEYVAAGARLVGQEEVWAESNLLLKVKEPIESEYGFLHEDLTLFTYLHLAAAPPLIEALLAAGTTAIAYETVEDRNKRLPLLAPMSEIAGRLASQAAAYFLQAPMGGRGTLIGGAPGVQPAKALVLGGGAVGANAAQIAVGMGAEVTILEMSLDRIRQLEDHFGRTARVLYSDSMTISQMLPEMDVVVGAVLIPGAKAPHLIKRGMLGDMKEGSVIVDVAIDQGGCFETSHPTTHDEPVFVVDGVVHYCVANMPGAVPVTSTRALTNATLPYARLLAREGVDGAFKADAGLVPGLNTRGGEIAHPAVAEAHAEMKAA